MGSLISFNGNFAFYTYFNNKQEELHKIVVFKCCGKIKIKRMLSGSEHNENHIS